MSGTAAIHMAEAYYGLDLAVKLGLAALDLEEFHGSPHPIRSLLCGMRPGTLQDATAERFTSLPVGPVFTETLTRVLSSNEANRLGLLVPTGDNAPLPWARERAFAVLINTATVVCGDAVALLIRFFDQGKDHCWVRGEDRAWLADVIDAGRGTGVLRATMGWEEAAKFLRSNDTETVVMSHPGAWFPTQEYAGFRLDEVPGHENCDGEDVCQHEEAWDEYPDDTRWRRALDGLLNRPERRDLRLGPGTLHVPIQGVAGSTIFDLARGYHRDPMAELAAWEPSSGAR
jgi:hypothetical protein